MGKIFNRYRSLFAALKKYRHHYGPFSDILLSPYFHIAIFVWIFFVFLPSSNAWWELAISMLPTMIGFTLAGYAIMLSFAADKIGPLIAAESFEEESAYIRASTTFFHFILVQIICFLNSLISMQLNSSSIFSEFLLHFAQFDYLASRVSNFVFSFYNFFGALAFFYSISLSLATLIAVYRLTGVLDRALTAQLQQQQSDDE